MSNQTPSVGRIVHYQAYGTPGGEFKSVPRAAIVVEVYDAEAGDIGVCVLNPQGMFFNRVKFSEEPKPGHWNWPPFVPQKKPTIAELESILAREGQGAVEIQPDGQIRATGPQIHVNGSEFNDRKFKVLIQWDLDDSEDAIFLRAKADIAKAIKDASSER